MACVGGTVRFRAGGEVSASAPEEEPSPPAGAAPDQGRGHHPGRDSCPCTHPSAPAIDSIDALPPSPTHSTTLPRPPFIPAVSAEASRPDKESGCGGRRFASDYRPTLSLVVQGAGSSVPCPEAEVAGGGPRRQSPLPPLGSQQGDDLVSPSSDHPGGRASLQAEFYPRPSPSPGDCLHSTAGVKSPPSLSELPPLPLSKQSLPLPLPSSKGPMPLSDFFPRPRLSQQLLRVVFLGLSRQGARGPRDLPSFLGLSGCSVGGPRDLPSAAFLVFSHTTFCSHRQPQLTCCLRDVASSCSDQLLSVATRVG